MPNYDDPAPGTTPIQRFLEHQEAFLIATGWKKDPDYPQEGYPFNRWTHRSDTAAAMGYTQAAATERQLELDGYYDYDDNEVSELCETENEGYDDDAASVISPPEPN